VPWEAAVPIDKDVPFEYAALLGCAVSTGVGAAINTARVRPGTSVAVIGLGGVGLSVVQGATIAGAATIVAVDPNEAKHPIAMKLGATHVAVPDTLHETTTG
jgi:Zn-dependent alcohol dehydrogenase